MTMDVQNLWLVTEASMWSRGTSLGPVGPFSVARDCPDFGQPWGCFSRRRRLHAEPGEMLQKEKAREDRTVSRRNGHADDRPQKHTAVTQLAPTAGYDVMGCNRSLITHLPQNLASNLGQQKITEVGKFCFLWRWLERLSMDCPFAHWLIPDDDFDIVLPTSCLPDADACLQLSLQGMTT